MIMTYKVGDLLYYIQDHSNQSPQAVEIIKVGRKWLTVKTEIFQFRLDKKTLESEYRQGRAYSSVSELAYQRDRTKLRNEITNDK